jgi:hypothetical protein
MYPRRIRTSFLDSLLGGGQQRQEYQDFTQRYDQGAPRQGISDQVYLHRRLKAS